MLRNVNDDAVIAEVTLHETFRLTVKELVALAQLVKMHESNLENMAIAREIGDTDLYKSYACKDIAVYMLIGQLQHGDLYKDELTDEVSETETYTSSSSSSDSLYSPSASSSDSESEYEYESETEAAPASASHYAELTQSSDSSSESEASVAEVKTPELVSRSNSASRNLGLFSSRNSSQNSSRRSSLDSDSDDSWVKINAGFTRV